MSREATLRLVVIEQIKRVLIPKGFKEDAHGHWVKHVTGGPGDDYYIRYQFNERAVRRELRIAEPGSKWGACKSAYYKDITIEDNQVKGLVPGGS